MHRMTSTHDLNQVLRDDLVEASEKGFNLILDRGIEAILRRQHHELPLILFSNWNLGTAFFEVNNSCDSKLDKKYKDADQAERDGDHSVPRLPRR